jgi:predicted nucleic acid-binding protein
MFGAEVVSALRALVGRGELSPERAAAARERAREVRTFQYPFEPFSRRVSKLRHSLSAYVALAEWLNSDLVTADERLARAVGPRCPIRLV